MPIRNIKTAERLFPEFQPMSLKYKDVFDLEELYKAMHDWLAERGWSEIGDTLDRWETSYTEVIGKGGVKELKFWWRLQKKPANTDAFMYYLDIDFHGLGLKDTEVIKSGQKIKAQKGELTMRIIPWLDIKYKGEFEAEEGKTKGWLKKTMESWITGVALRKVTEQTKKELYQESYQLQNFLKQWFKLKRYLPYEETKNFGPSYAWPAHIKE